MPELIHLNGDQQDLYTTYMIAFDDFATDPAELVARSEGRVNTRYAREMLGTLVSGGLLAVTEGDEGDVWQVVNPGTYDETNRENAVNTIVDWLTNNKEKITVSDTATTSKAKEQTFHPCYCGCKENVPAKSYYRPGHDARHAGQIGRQAALLDPGSPEYDNLFSDLPSESLVAKAKGIEGKARDKADAKAQREQEKADRKAAKEAKEANHTEDGIVKVGKNEYAATRDTNTGEVVYYKGDKVLTASPTAAKTFSTE